MADGRSGTGRRDDHYGEAWVYESIVGAIPGLSLPDRVAVAIQFVVFEAVVLGIAAVYGLRHAVLPGTAAVAVAAVGSWFMLDIAVRARAVELPSTYRRLLFSSNVEVVLGVVAYAGFGTYLFTSGSGSGPSLFGTLFGGTPPPLAVFALLLVVWDVCYRIGTGWWTALVTLYATLRYELSPAATADVRGVEARTMAFALVQLALVPFVLPHPVLALAVTGHVAAVGLVLAVAVLAGRN